MLLLVCWDVKGEISSTVSKDSESVYHPNGLQGLKNRLSVFLSDDDRGDMLVTCTSQDERLACSGIQESLLHPAQFQSSCSSHIFLGTGL